MSFVRVEGVVSAVAVVGRLGVRVAPWRCCVVGVNCEVGVAGGAHARVLCVPGGTPPAAHRTEPPPWESTPAQAVLERAHGKMQ